MRSVTIFIIIVSGILFLSLCSYADDGTHKRILLVFDGESRGPFGDTKIVRFKDPDYNVVCYMYLPEYVTTSITYAGGKGGTAFTSFAGNISCVKVKGSLW
jgi:hypothetical protein